MKPEIEDNGFKECSKNTIISYWLEEEIYINLTL